MTANTDAIRLHEIRVKWKSLALKKLSADLNCHDFDSCLSKLEQAPASKEVAVAAFWIAYVPDKLPFSLSESQESKVESILDRPLGSQIKDTYKQALLYVKLMLAGILAIYRIRPNQPFAEFPDAVAALEKAHEADRLLSFPDSLNELYGEDPTAWGWKFFWPDLFAFSSVLVNGIINMELSLVYSERRQYEEAFSCMNSAGWCLSGARIESQLDDPELVPHLPAELANLGHFVPYLPHSLQPFNIQDAVGLFEEIKRHPKDIKDWDTVQAFCGSFRYLGYNGLYDWLSHVKSEDFPPVSAEEYWGKALTFAQVHGSIVTSPFQVPTQDAIEKSDTRQRLRRDFFRDSWDQLGKKSQEFLIDAEIGWLHSRLDTMIKDIRPLLEIELQAVFPFLVNAAQQNDPRLILTRIRDALKGNKLVQDSIDALAITGPDKAWLKGDLWRFLYKVIDTRNFFEKQQTMYDTKSEKYREMTNTAKLIHNELLGIQCGHQGVLPRLMMIKMRLKPK